MAEDKIHIANVHEEDERCIRCGSPNLDTGWECNNCGYDNMPHYYRQGDAGAPSTPATGEHT